jgi:hypothetical protein
MSCCLFDHIVYILTVSQVDFMIDNFLNQPVFREEFGAAEAWLAGMNAAAITANYTVQCTSTSIPAARSL